MDHQGSPISQNILVGSPQVFQGRLTSDLQTKLYCIFCAVFPALRAWREHICAHGCIILTVWTNGLFLYVYIYIYCTSWRYFRYNQHCPGQCETAYCDQGVDLWKEWRQKKRKFNGKEKVAAILARSRDILSPSNKILSFSYDILNIVLINFLNNNMKTSEYNWSYARMHSKIKLLWK